MTTTTIDYKCPAWCERTDHDADVVNADNPPFHYAPDFGPICIQAEGDGPFEIRVLEEQIADAAGIRQLAADALAAAEWMEAHS